MKTNDNEFIFHNVGQGLFYSGRIGNFNFVYDCGTESKKNILENSIKSYYSSSNNSQIDTYDKKHIDLLILSHFHNDHINGLNKLFDKFNVKDVIIPYYAPNERFLMAIENVYSGQDNDDIIKFVLGPIEYLIKKKVGRIIIVMPTKEREGNDYIEDTGYDSNGLWEDNNIELIYDIKRNKNPLNKELKAYKVKYPNKLYFYNHNLFIKLQKQWEFRFFCHDYGKKEDIYNFNRQIKRLLKGKKLIDAIEDEKLRIKIKDKYERLTLKIKIGKKPKLNLTSLVVFHSPPAKDFHYLNVIKNLKNVSRKNEYNIFQEMDISNSKDCFIRIIKERYLEEFKAIMSIRGYNPRSFGQFLLSDAELRSDLNKPNNFYSHFNTHFSDIFKNVAITLIPHHGSENNWNDELLTHLNNCYCWIPSYGLNNSHDHPSGKVLCKIIKEDRLILPCDEEAKICLSFK